MDYRFRHEAEHGATDGGAMNLSGIYKKTDKGAEEIKSRAHGLHPRSRTLLILVDGKTSMEALLKKAAVATEAYQQLQSLLEGGFIEEIAGAGAPAPGASDSANVDLTAVKRLAVKMLHDAMGPDADMFAARIESVKTPAEFRIQAEKFRDAVKAARGSRFAEQFWNDISQQLPS